MQTLPLLQGEKLSRIQEQIDNQRRSVAFNMREFTMEIYVNNYLDHTPNRRRTS